MAYMVEDRLKSAAEEANKEIALKEVVEDMGRERNAAVENAKERVRAMEGARILVELKVVEMAAKLEEVELRLVGVERVNSARDNEIAELKATLDESENKWYNMGFADAENSTELIMFHLGGMGLVRE